MEIIASAWSIDHHTRIKPKKESTFGKKKSIFKKKSRVEQNDLDYLKWAKQQPLECFVCGNNQTQLHHIKKNSTDKKNHKELLPLCVEHHLGNVLSPHGTPSKFRETYTMEVQRQSAKDLYLQYVKNKI